MYGWNSFVVWVTGEPTAGQLPVLWLDVATAASVAVALRGTPWSRAGVARACAVVLIATMLVNPHLYLQELVLVPLALAFAWAGAPEPRSLPLWGALVVVFWVVDLLARVPGPIPGPMLFQIAACGFIVVPAAVSLRRGREAEAVAGEAPLLAA
jgi:hypothetical protein